MAKQKKASRFIWVGDGTERIIGVPARDLSVEESLQHAAVIERVHANTGRVLYRNEATEEGEEE